MAQAFVPLAGLKAADRPAAAEDEERCDLCAAAIPPEHRHLLELSKRQVLCACRACSLLFDQPGAGAGGRRLIPNRRLYLPNLALSEADWAELRVPVNIAFFVRHEDGRAAAYYPSPMGATQSPLAPETWRGLEASNPVLASMAPEVEALLVDRLSQAQQAFLVGIDSCFELVGLVRMSWRGFSGGSEVWRALDGFFADLRERSCLS